MCIIDLDFFCGETRSPGTVSIVVHHENGLRREALLRRFTLKVKSE
jgi:hypothetical protein